MAKIDKAPNLQGAESKLHPLKMTTILVANRSFVQ